MLVDFSPKLHSQYLLIMYHSIPYSYYPSFSSPYDGYVQALAEEQAARDQYLNALQQQREAQDRVARARLARQAYDRSPYNSYLSSSDDEAFVTGSSLQSPYSNSTYEPNIPLSRGLDSYGISPHHQRRALFEDQRRQEYQELQRAREKERLMQLVEEERRKQFVEEELRRRIREEERQRRVREEESRRKILEEERARAEQQQLRQQRLGELEQLYRDLGFRPTARSQPAEQVSSLCDSHIFAVLIASFYSLLDVLVPCLLLIANPLLKRTQCRLESAPLNPLHQWLPSTPNGCPLRSHHNLPTLLSRSPQRRRSKTSTALTSLASNP